MRQVGALWLHVSTNQGLDHVDKWQREQQECSHAQQQNTSLQCTAIEWR